ncbi:winged helix-turn-helix domain-containing protein [Aurantimonas sp. A3-2-R12]|uniref:winged helix-turn-helix domain-containing tetratricopeptide repeat protein n=2 Tax=unclassified Aurantimonas TaxID=2638230 RepID=UPI002EC1A208|nr:winged helix-turn-helix domain-containing protein [Aurantimonas sp. A3-2-R12]
MLGSPAEHALYGGWTMLYVFEPFELDASQVELRHNGTVVPVEPQVFALLVLLVENRERMISKDEIVEKIWDGRIVSDSAITSRIKSARRALGDDGRTQCFIRTVHGQGLRFIAEVKTVASQGSRLPASPCRNEWPIKIADDARPSIAVLPFRLLGVAGSHGAIADALPHDLIAALSRLRWLFVIARGSSFRFRSPDPDVGEIGEILNVRYCLSGIVEIFGNATTVVVELADTRTGGVVWGDRFAARLDDIHEIRSQIVANIIAALEIQIPLNEANLARLGAPENLDAWSTYHLGLQHLYRFNKKDNAVAAGLFESAIAKEPRFARAHAGLSSTAFQNAFLRYTDDPPRAVATARKFAERSVELDPIDPFANFTMGRAFWLTGDIDGSLSWLDRSTGLSPNYAQGFYARAWADTICERDMKGTENARIALSLSPLDPFRYAMLGTRAFACLIRGDTAEAVDWADRAARSPGAHVLIAMIAIVAHALNGDERRAALWAADARARRDDISQTHFFSSFPFADGPLRRRISKTLADQGFS